MNNRFKFRVWDHILSEWIKSDQLVLRPNGSVTDGSILIDSKYIQFNTGLTDNNDVSIYEGDILSECIDNRTELGICKQILGGWKIFSHPNSSICWHGNQHKVIGNIFETPQLLK
jgi:hypothetical protein